MKEHIVKELDRRAKNLAKEYSKPSRNQYSGQTFTFKEIITHSDHSASVIFNKSGGKRAVALAFYKKNWKGVWKWHFNFFSDLHMLGIIAFPKIKKEIEAYNFRVSLKGKAKKDDPF